MTQSPKFCEEGLTSLVFEGILSSNSKNIMQSRHRQYLNTFRPICSRFCSHNTFFLLQENNNKTKEIRHCFVYENDFMVNGLVVQKCIGSQLMCLCLYLKLGNSYSSFRLSIFLWLFFSNNCRNGRQSHKVGSTGILITVGPQVYGSTNNTSSVKVIRFPVESI